MIPTVRDFDVLHMGRAGLDLYSNDIGAPFAEITSFAAYVGGSPANVCVGARRLGLNVAMLTALGDDLPGDFVASFLQREGVDMRWVVRKPGFRTGAAMLAIDPPDHFSLVYYRDRPADLELDLDDLVGAPIAQSRVLQLAGTNLARDPSRTATMAAAEAAAEAGTTVVLDLDFRADQWPDPRRFGFAVRALLPFVDVVLGTEDELKAAVLRDRAGVRVVDSQVSEADVDGDVADAVGTLAARGPRVVVCKHGGQGSTVHRRAADGVLSGTYAAGFSVPVRNTLGAGDAYAAGFIFSLLQGWDDLRAACFANACGAIVVSRHGCSVAMPTRDEVERLLVGGEGAGGSALSVAGGVRLPAGPQNTE
jgi:5-dehydro-2-deoxygluconokinase